MPPLVKDPRNIRLAMLGMVEGNGHPYSWSAIINGEYDAARMAECGYPAIPEYLGAQPAEALGIPGTMVTHVWCDDPADAERVAATTFIPNVVEQPENVIGQVDAVIIPTDKGWEHVERARPFIEAGLPVFVDKPLADNEDDLRQFVEWQAAGKAILSTSCMRYAREYAQLRNRLAEVGSLRLITMTMSKSWERYGIHALEGVYPFLPPGGWISVRHGGDAERNIMHLRHRDGVDVLLAVVADLFGAFGHLRLYGTRDAIGADFDDMFNAFKDQLVAFVTYLRTGQLPFEFSQTVELVKLVIAGLRSRERHGAIIELAEILP